MYTSFGWPQQTLGGGAVFLKNAKEQVVISSVLSLDKVGKATNVGK
jgi:hypothetical protein